MRFERIGLVGAIAGVVLGGVVAMAGCDGGGDAASGADEAEVHGGGPFHRRHHGHDAGSVGGSAAGTTGAGGAGGSMSITTTGTGTGGAVANCDLCTQAQQCCDVVETEGPGCTFSAAKCASEPGDALPAYANNCLVFLVTVRGAWGGNPPAECR